MRLFTQILLVSLGSSIGGLTRWGVSVGAARLVGTAYPWGTLFINLTGSLFLGWFMTVVSDRYLATAASRWLQPDNLKLMVAVGFTGAYTTFSTFEFESNKLIVDRDWLAAASYMAGSVFVGLLAVRLGVYIAKML